MTADVTVTRETTSELENIFEDIRATLNEETVPELFLAMAPAPAYLATTWHKYRTVMETGEIDRKDKEFIGMAAAVAQASDYMVAFQQKRLKQLGASEAQLVEALAVTDFFEGFDAFAQALHVDSELRPRKMMGGDLSLVDKEIDVNVPYVLECDDDTVNAVYTDVREKFGIPFVPNIFKAMAHCPDVLEAKWESYKAIMCKGKIRRLTKELIAVAVSAVNGCDY